MIICRFVPELQLVPELVGALEELERILEVAGGICEDAKAHGDNRKTIRAGVVFFGLVEADGRLGIPTYADKKERVIAKKITLDPFCVICAPMSAPLAIAQHAGLACEQFSQGSQEPVALLLHVLELEGAGPNYS